MLDKIKNMFLRAPILISTSSFPCIASCLLPLLSRPADVGIHVPELLWMGRRREDPRYVVGIEPIPQTTYVDKATQAGVPLTYRTAC